MKTINSYKFRIYPDKEQEEQLFKTIGSARKVYNLLLEEYEGLYSRYKNGEITKDVHHKDRKSLNHAVFRNSEEYGYLKEVDSTALKYAHKHVNRAYSNFFNGVSDKPVFKKKNVHKWSYTTCRASKTSRNLRLEKGGNLTLPKVPGRVRTVVSKNPRGTLVSATITKTRSDKWFVSLQYESHDKVVVRPDTVELLSSPVGVDMGIKELAITSDGVTYGNNKVGYLFKKRIARLDKKLSRQREQAKKDGRKLSECRNYQKTRIARAKAYEKVSNIRKDTLHKITTDLVNNHDFIGIENLSSKNLLKNHNLAFAISDASWNEFITFLSYKAHSRGTVVQKIDRFYASTQICSGCLSQTGPKGLGSLGIREWACSDCGIVHDRDVNAAVNILRESLRVCFAVGTTGNQALKISG